MRLKRITKVLSLSANFTPVEILHIEFSTNGVLVNLPLELPAGWEGWTRQEKIAWVKTEVSAHLQTMNYTTPGEVIYPQIDAGEVAANALESDLPQWATWTASEADAWIAANVANLADAKLVLRNMAKMICFLRDMVVEK